MHFTFLNRLTGGTPYASTRYSDAELLIKRICEDGYRLPKPQRCSDDTYSLMRRCWKHDPNERPSASDVLAFLTKTRITKKVRHFY